MSSRSLSMCVALVTLCQLAAARELIVSPTGDDGAAGTPEAPLKSIGKAADLARAGDTILLREGTYIEGVRLSRSGSQGMPITLKNFPGERPVIQPGQPGREAPAHGILLQASEGHARPIGWIVIEGLEIRYGHDGIKLYNAHDFLVRGCNIHHNWNQGMLGNGVRVTIDRNVIAHNGQDPQAADNQVHGIYAGGTDFQVTSNLIHSNRSYGIQVAAYPYKSDSHAGQEYAGAKNWLISNNTLALQKHRGGIVIWMEDTTKHVVQNNIFYKNGGENGMLFYGQGGKRHQVRNNIFFPPGENLVSTEKDDHDPQDNQEVDPLFADAAALDFRLTKGSPAIDKGFADLAPRNDISGAARPQKDRVDIGAYEY